MRSTKQDSRLLLITYVWPEPRSSAAGVRDWNLIDLFLKAGWDLTIASQSAESEHSKVIRDAGARTRVIAANDPSFDDFLRELRPDYVIFDRFVTEEQFGWRVEEVCPEAVRILDTQDLHFLRRARENALKEGAPLEAIYRGEIPLRTEDALREIAAIYRSDLTLVLSSFERKLLEKRFEIPASLLELFPFCMLPDARFASFGERKNFVMIGNFRHPPNADAVRWLQAEIWPKIRAKLPAAEVHVYGAYPPKEMMNLDDPGTGFRVLGPAKEARETLSGYRVNLAPLRFGAGIKGKIAEGWACGIPAATTPIGAEGMGDDESAWGGAITRNAEELALAAIRLHEDEERWNVARENGRRLVSSLFDPEKNGRSLLDRLSGVRGELQSRREANFVGSMLRFHLHRSTRYLSKWIELKNQPTQAR